MLANRISFSISGGTSYFEKAPEFSLSVGGFLATKNGASEWIRTIDRRFTKPLLYH
jgi:hypothetical protein